MSETDLSLLTVNSEQFTVASNAVAAINEIANFNEGGSSSENNGGGEAAWGGITGNIQKQLDLIAKFDEISNKLQKIIDNIPRIFVAEGNSAGSNFVRLDLLGGLYFQISGTTIVLGNASGASKLVDVRRANIYGTSTVGSTTGNNTTIPNGTTFAIQTLTSAQQSSDASVIGYLRDVDNNLMYEFGYFISASAVRTTLFAKLLTDNSQMF